MTVNPKPDSPKPHVEQGDLSMLLQSFHELLREPARGPPSLRLKRVGASSRPSVRNLHSWRQRAKVYLP